MRRYFAVLLFGIIHLLHHQKRGILKYLYLIGEVGRREEKMLIYANIIELETYLIVLEIRINETELKEFGILPF